MSYVIYGFKVDKLDIIDKLEIIDIIDKCDIIEIIFNELLLHFVNGE